MSAGLEADLAEDRAADRRLLMLGVFVITGLLAFGVTTQSMLVHGIGPILVGDVPLDPFSEALLRLAVNAVAVLILGFGSGALGLTDRSVRAAALLAVSLVLVATAVRLILQLLLGVYPWSQVPAALTDAALVVPFGALAIGVSALLVSLRRRARAAERQRQAAARRAAESLAELQREELRVRRDVADALHGSLQNRFLLLGAALEDVSDRLTGAVEEAQARELGARLRQIRRELDELRERELRELSAALYPEALDRGLVPACRALVARIPRSLPVRFDAADVPTPDPLDRTARLLLVRVVEEGVSNALRHGGAAALELLLVARDGKYAVEVRHRGAEPAPDPRLSGLARLRTRLEELGGGLTLTAESGGGVLRGWIAEAAGVPGREPQDRQGVSLR